MGGVVSAVVVCFRFFFFNDTATTEIYTLSLHDALPIAIPGSLFQACDDLRRHFMTLCVSFKIRAHAPDRFHERADAGFVDVNHLRALQNDYATHRRAFYVDFSWVAIDAHDPIDMQESCRSSFSSLARILHGIQCLNPRGVTVKFTLQFDCDNDAFSGADLDKELYYVLKNVANHILNYGSKTDQVLRDSNGNTIGNAWLRE